MGKGVVISEIRATAGLRSGGMMRDPPPSVLLGEVIIIKTVCNTSKAGFNFAKLVMKRMD